MKGPGNRIDLDVRRIWKCSRCGRVAKYLGDVVALRCSCGAEPAWMQLSDAPRRPRAVQHAVVHPADAGAAADASDERQRVARGEPAVAPVVTEPQPAAEPSEVPAAEVVVVEQVTVVTETVVTETVVSLETPVVEAAKEEIKPAAVTPPVEDDFGAGLVD